MNEKSLMNLPRREIAAFHQWMRSLPKEQTSFLAQSFDTEEVRAKKMMELYAQYQARKSNRK